MQASGRKVSCVCCPSPPGPRACGKGLHTAGAEEKLVERMNLKRKTEEESRDYDRQHCTDKETLAWFLIYPRSLM